MSEKEDQSLAKAAKVSSGWGTFVEGPGPTATPSSIRNKSGSSTSMPASKSPTRAKLSRMRARINSGDLLLQESPDGLVMSPAMRRRREIVGSSLASLKETASGGLRNMIGVGRGSTRENPFRKGVSYERLSEADSAGNMKDDASSDGGSRSTRQRSSTWDEHGIAKQQEHKREVMGRPGAGGDAGGGGRVRTWSHHGAYGHHAQDARPGTEWEHLDGFQAMGSMFQQELYHEKSSGLAEVLADKLRVPLLIILVGILAAFAGMAVDYSSSWARMWRINQTAARREVPFEWLVYGITSLGLTLGMCAITHFVCPCAAGGGVPEMKAVLSGASRPGLLSVRLVIVKAMGVIAANAAGLSVGKEGPLIHITCAMADILMSTSWFRKVRLNNMQRLGILACACAAGVAATFGSVFGGTLFSVEVTATAYMVDTLPATFLCAVVVAVVYWASGNGELFTLISDETAQAQGFTGTDLFAWGLLGAVCGLVGAFFVAVLDALSVRRNFFTRKDLAPSTRKLRMLVVVALATLLVVPASYTEAIAFSVDDPTGRAKFHPLIDRIYDQQEFGMSWHLIQLLLLKFWTTVFSVVQPLPVGLFSPIFVIGGLMGRIFGEMAQWTDRYVDSVTINFQPWEFALIGSAAFSAGVTRAVSTAVIVFELSGENHLRLPLGVALMISYFIANRFTKGIYDALMDTNGTPHLEEVPPEDRNVPAEDVMVPVDELPCLSLNCTGEDASDIVSLSQPGQVIPVVQSMSDKVLVGVVLWNDLAIALADYRRRDSAMADNRRRSRGNLGSSLLASIKREGHTFEGIDSPETTAAAAAATGKLDKFDWEEASSEGGGSAGEREVEEGGGSLWPGLAGIAKAVGERVGWFPRMRLAEASLLQKLDKQRAESTEGEQLDAFYMTRPGREEQEDHDNHDTTLPPLGEGIPYGVSPEWDEQNGGGDDEGGTMADFGVPLAESKPSGHNRNFTSPSSSAVPQRTPVGAATNATTPGKAPSNTGGSTTGEGSASTATGVRRAGGRNPVRGKAGAFALTAVEKAKRAPLRFFLVREGNKFVAVGRTLTKGTWRELPEVLASTVVPAASYGIPVVLDPSPYQVTHTTELSKVDIAFRLLKLDNAYVCNAGRLVGIITREILADFVDQREVSPMDDCVRLCGALACCLPKTGPKSSNTAEDGKVGRRGSRRKSARANIPGMPPTASSARDGYSSQSTAQEVTGKVEGGNGIDGGIWDPV